MVMRKATAKRRKDGIVTDATLKRVWTKKVRGRDNNRCVICGDTVLPNAHHIISIDNKSTRWDIHNGITLCPSHHKFDNTYSAHKNPRRFFEWLLINRPEINEYLRTVEDKEFDDDWNRVYEELKNQ
jgi:5-methylcytosine-specific restriction endonuclease McrA